MEFKGTKGEWEVIDWNGPSKTAVFSNFDNHEEKLICETHYHNDNKGTEWEESLANAKLIAAAPELLEALQELCFLNSCEEEAISSGRPKPEDWLNGFRKAESAIKKAIG